MVKYFLVAVMMIMTMTPALAELNSQETENFVDDVSIEDSKADFDEDKVLVPCRVDALDRFGFVIGRFFSFKPFPHSRCVRAQMNCRQFLQRNREFGFCREIFRRFP